MHLLVGSLEIPWQPALPEEGVDYQAATGIRMRSGHWTLSQDGMTGGEGESRSALTGERDRREHRHRPFFRLV